MQSSSEEQKQQVIDAKRAIDEHTRGSKIGLDGRVWGAPAWRFLHSVTFNYPDNPDTSTQELYRRFFSIVGDVLPCKICRQHYKEHTAANVLPIRLESRRALVEWMIDVHNRANESTGKRKHSYEEVIRDYTCAYCKCLSIPGYEHVKCRPSLLTYALILGVAWLIARKHAA